MVLDPEEVRVLVDDFDDDDFEEDDFEDELPEIPLYSNDYHDFFTSKLHDFEEDGYNWDATNAILYANME